MDALKWFLFLVGHIGLWCVVFNRVHATAFPRKARKVSEKIVLLMVAVPLAAILFWLIWNRQWSFETFHVHSWIWAYAYGCVLLGVFFAGRWVYRKWALRLPKVVVESDRERIDVRKELPLPVHQGRLSNWLGKVPINESSQLTIERMTFELPVSGKIDGLKICQLSDLHFTGQIAREYFEFVVNRANEFEPDLIVVTGDLVDEAKCLDWIDQTLGKLRARLGVYYVLGNHDKRIKDEADLRQRLERAGLIQASGQWLEIRDGERRIQLTGNALPWFPDANQLDPNPPEPAHLRILLTHSPDQLDWARKYDFDLIFAGHTHGGQIAFPLIGPIVAPSKYGVLYASGTFQIGKTLMHVSRGLSGDEPIRIGSPPELGLFTIQAAE